MRPRPRAREGRTAGGAGARGYLLSGRTRFPRGGSTGSLTPVSGRGGRWSLRIAPTGCCLSSVGTFTWLIDPPSLITASVSSSRMSATGRTSRPQCAQMAPRTEIQPQWSHATPGVTALASPPFCWISTTRGGSGGRFSGRRAESWAREVEPAQQSDVVRSWLVCPCPAKLVEL